MNLNASLKILGLDPQADPDQAKRAYKAQVRRWHPDQFPEVSTTKAEAEEQLKQINIAYAQVKAYIARRRPDSTSPTAGQAPQPSQNKADRRDSSDEKSPKRAWVDHLFDTLNALAGNRAGDPQPSPPGETTGNRRRTFEQVLDEMTGGEIPASSTHRRANAPPAGRRTAAGYPGYRRPGDSVDALNVKERVGPVKPVSRVRGIGRSR